MQKRTDEVQRREFHRCHLRGESYSDIDAMEGSSYVIKPVFILVIRDLDGILITEVIVHLNRGTQ
jgi:hypothetical protein